MSQLTFEKLNKNYAPDPNTAFPLLEIHGNDVNLIFPLNFLNGNFEEGERGSIKFKNCMMFRVGSPNDEGFFDPENKKNEKRWNKKDYPELEFDSLYAVEGVNWKDDFGPNAFINHSMNELSEIGRMKHYIFFMKENTFECIAEGMQEEIPVRG